MDDKFRKTLTRYFARHENKAAVFFFLDRDFFLYRRSLIDDEELLVADSFIEIHNIEVIHSFKSQNFYIDYSFIGNKKRLAGSFSLSVSWQDSLLKNCRKKSSNITVYHDSDFISAVMLYVKFLKKQVAPKIVGWTTNKKKNFSYWGLDENSDSDHINTRFLQAEMDYSKSPHLVKQYVTDMLSLTDKKVVHPLFGYMLLTFSFVFLSDI